jgi:hypothetical protein
MSPSPDGWLSEALATRDLERVNPNMRPPESASTTLAGTSDPHDSSRKTTRHSPSPLATTPSKIFTR